MEIKVKQYDLFCVSLGNQTFSFHRSKRHHGPVVSHYRTNLNCRKQADFVGLSEMIMDDLEVPTQVHLWIWGESQLPG